MNILVLGPIGSGKSTQADLLAQQLAIPHLSGGDVLHYASESTDPKYKDIRKKMLSGELVDGDMVIELMEEHLKGKEHKKGTIIDGFPRNIEEAKKFSVLINKVVYITLPDAEVIKRLTIRGREDDTPEVIQNRIRIYHSETEPVLNFYREKGVLEEIDGNRSVEEVSLDIQKLFV